MGMHIAAASHQFYHAAYAAKKYKYFPKIQF